jgi:hypothetical protein
MSAPLLAVENLSISFPGEAGPVRVVDRVSLSIALGETLSPSLAVSSPERASPSRAATSCRCPCPTCVPSAVPESA